MTTIDKTPPAEVSRWAPWTDLFGSGNRFGQLLENGRTNIDMATVFLAIFLILLVGIAIDLLIFSPLERRVLRGRGLLVKS